MSTQTIRGRVPDELVPMYQALLDYGYTASEIAREGIRAKYRQMNSESMEVKA